MYDLHGCQATVKPGLHSALSSWRLLLRVAGRSGAMDANKVSPWPWKGRYPRVLTIAGGFLITSDPATGRQTNRFAIADIVSTRLLDTTLTVGLQKGCGCIPQYLTLQFSDGRRAAALVEQLGAEELGARPSGAAPAMDPELLLIAVSRATEIEDSASAERTRALDEISRLLDAGVDVNVRDQSDSSIQVCVSCIVVQLPTPPVWRVSPYPRSRLLAICSQADAARGGHRGS